MVLESFEHHTNKIKNKWLRLRPGPKGRETFGGIKLDLKKKNIAAFEFFSRSLHTWQSTRFGNIFTFQSLDRNPRGNIRVYFSHSYVVKIILKINFDTCA